MVGERVAVVATEDTPPYVSSSGVQHVRVTDPADGTDLGEIGFQTDHAIRTGERLEVRVDPHGWVEPDGITTVDPKLRAFGLTLAGIGVGVPVLLTVLRARRDLRRHRLTGTRLYTAPPWPAPPAREPGEQLDVDGVLELADHDSDSGDYGD